MKQEFNIDNLNIRKEDCPVSPNGVTYPFDKLEVGFMFELPFDRNTRNLLYTRLQRLRKAHPDIEFVFMASKSKNYIKCWRTK